MSRALVLNATSEPVGVVSARRAVVLYIDNKVDVVAASDRCFGSERLTVAVPEVVRLRYFVKVPYHRTAPLNRRTVFARDDHICQYCGRSAESLDHVVPRSRGGAHTWDNVVACCRRCNTLKGDRLVADTPLALRRAPRPPARDLWLIAGGGRVPNSWNPYLDNLVAA